jgi:hypothetical protein
MPIPQSFLTQGLAATSLGALTGFLRNNRFSEGEQLSTEEAESRQLKQLGIGATTTAGILGLTWYAAARSKNPTLSVMGAALAGGAAYGTARIYSSLETKRQAVSGEEKSLSSRLLESAAGLGSLYYGGKALAPYLARSVARMDSQFRPWYSSFTKTVEETQLNNIGGFASRFEKTLNQAQNVFSNAPAKYPVQSHLGMISRIQKEISNVDLKGTATEQAVNTLFKKHGITNLEVVNGLRSATIADAIRLGRPIDSLTAVRNAGVDFSSVGLGKGVMFDTVSNRILNLNAYTPKKLVSNTILGFTNNFHLPIFNYNPIKLFRPDEWIGALEQGTQFHKFNAGAPIGPGVTAGKEGAAFVGGKLFDIASGKQIGKGSLIEAGSYEFPKDIRGKRIKGTNPIYHETVFGETARKRQYTGGYKFNAPNDKWWQKTLNALEMDIPFLHKTGFAENPSRWEKAAHPIINRKGKGGLLSAIKSMYKATLGTAEFEELKPSTSGKDVFTAVSKNFKKKSGEQFQSKTAFAFVPQHDMPGSTAFWLFNRPTRLMEDIGLGNFNPATTHSAADVVWKMFFKRFLPLYASYQLVSAGNDLTRGVFGYGPSDLLADTATGFNMGSAYLRDTLGITDMAKYLEELMPGITSSSGMSLIRGMGIPLVAGAYGGKTGFFSGLAASAFLGGASTRALTMEGSDYYDEYFGHKRVPVRSGRWWMFGGTPFEGTKPKYFAPNWYKKHKAHAEFTDVQYGSEFEYWSNYADPYHYAIKHYEDRPYPIVTSGAQDLPFLGPMIGGLLAPPMMMHSEYLYGSGGRPGYYGVGGPGPGGITPGGGIGPGPGGTGVGSGGGYNDFVFPQKYNGEYIPGETEQQLPYGVAAGLGGLPPDAAIAPDSIKGRVGEQIYRGTEYLGIYGFMVNSANSRLSGNQDFFTQPQLESANRIAGAERAYWDLNIGDPFGTTELFRRFIPHRRRQIELVNPIPNTMPAWMPGSDYFTNFHQGDPYSKVELGEIRLPGSGYEKFYKPGEGITEAARQLGMANLGATAGKYEDYSMMDTYRILGGVAPYSRQYRFSQQYIMAMSKAGMLTPEADAERKYLKKEVTQMKKRYSFKPRTFTTGDTASERITVEKYLGAGRFTVEGDKGTIYDLAGVKGITGKGESYLESYLERGKSLSIQVLDDPRYRTKTSTVLPTVPVVIGDLNQSLIKKKMGEFKRTGPGEVYSPLNHKVKYDPLERAVGSLWETFSHADTPLHTKFLQNRSALESWERTQLYGRDSADWSHPYRDFIMPIGHKIAGMGPVGAGLVGGFVATLFGSSKVAKTVLGAAGLVGGAMAGAGNWGAAIPEYRKRQWDIDQYYDMLEYLKYRRLYTYSRDLAIEKEGIDPAKVIQTLEASRRARKEVKEAITQKYGEQSLAQLQEEDPENRKKIREEKRGLSAALQVLSRQKWTEDAAESAIESSTRFARAALRFREKYKSTMYGADVHGDFASIMRALPTKQREFFNAFMTAPAEERNEIASKVPLGMRRFLQAKWGEDVDPNPNLEKYFQDHYLPGESWIGWHPAVNLSDVQYKTVTQEGFDQHDFNMWQTQGEALKRKPYVPLIDPFSTKGNPQLIKQEISDIIGAQGYNNYELYIDEAAGTPGIELDFDIKYSTDTEARNYIRANLKGMLANAYVS